MVQKTKNKIFHQSKKIGFPRLLGVPFVLSAETAPLVAEEVEWVDVVVVRHPEKDTSSHRGLGCR